MTKLRKMRILPIMANEAEGSSPPNDTDAYSRLVETLTGLVGPNRAITLAGWATCNDAYEQAVLQTRCDTHATGSLNTITLPEVMLDVVLTEWRNQELVTAGSDDEYKEGEDGEELAVRRTLALRGLGGGIFKVLGSVYSPGTTSRSREKFDVDDEVRIGTARRNARSRLQFEPVLRLRERLFVLRGRHPELVTTRTDRHLVVSRVDIDGDEVLSDDSL